MALYYDLPLYRDTYQLILNIYEFTKDFPREYKYTLGQDMKRDGMMLVKSIYRANKYTDKETHLNDFLDYFELIKLQVRLSVDMKLLSIKRQAVLIEQMDKIGKQVNGWRKIAQSQSPKG
jgi:hypothetical protein